MRSSMLRKSKWRSRETTAMQFPTPTSEGDIVQTPLPLRHSFVLAPSSPKPIPIPSAAVYTTNIQTPHSMLHASASRILQHLTNHTNSVATSCGHRPSHKHILELPGALCCTLVPLCRSLAFRLLPITARRA